MKKIYRCLLSIIACCASLTMTAQDSVLLQRLPVLSQAKISYIESKLQHSIIQEAATRFPEQHSVIILSGNNSMAKQNTAMYLAQKAGMLIYRVPLSLVITSNIMETKRKLLNIFEAAKGKKWTLFFDEGDALFGRRQNVKDAHDKYDDPGTNYFNQLVTAYRGAIIISVKASNNINPWIFEKYIHFNIH